MVARNNNEAFAPAVFPNPNPHMDTPHLNILPSGTAE